MWQSEQVHSILPQLLLQKRRVRQYARYCERGQIHIEVNFDNVEKCDSLSRHNAFHLPIRPNDQRKSALIVGTPDQNRFAM